MSEADIRLKSMVEAVLMASDEPLNIAKLLKFFSSKEMITKELLREALAELAQDYSERSVELKELASGYCFQVKAEFSPWVSRLWEEKPPRYTRAALETLALIIYRQPITRAEIEEIRGVAVSTQIIKNLQDRHWIKVVGHKEVPGRPALYVTTQKFLDYFNLKDLTDLPPLAELQDLDGAEKVLSEQLSLTVEAPDNAQELQALVEEAHAIDEQSDVEENAEEEIS